MKRVALKLEHSSNKNSNTLDIRNTVLLESNCASVGLPLFNIKCSRDANQNTSPKTVLLTGSTGFLGVNILRELLAIHPLINIICLVRSGANMPAETRLIKTLSNYFEDFNKSTLEKVQIIEADLSKEHFGIDKLNYDELTSTVEIVIHVAADTNLLKSYSELEDINVRAVHRLVRFAQTGKTKEIHYVSTLAVSGYMLRDHMMNFSEMDFDYGQQFISGYEKSKFEAEKFLRNYISMNGAARIYRMGHIAANSQSAEFQSYGEKNRIFQIVSGLLLLGQIPDTYNEELAFSYVDIIARSIVNICMKRFETSMNCFHLESPHSISMQGLAAKLTMLGFPLKSVSYDTFRKTLEDFFGSPEENEQVAAMDMWIRRYHQYPRKVNYLRRHTLDLLSQHGLYFSEISDEWLTRAFQSSHKQDRQLAAIK